MSYDPGFTDDQITEARQRFAEAMMTGDPDRDLTNAEIAEDYLERAGAQRGALLPEWLLVMKLTGEASEAAEAWMQWNNWSRHPGTKEHLAEELADTVISAYALADVLGIDLDEAIQAKHTVMMRRDLRAGSTRDPDEEFHRRNCRACGHEPEGREIAMSDPDLT